MTPISLEVLGLLRQVRVTRQGPRLVVELDGRRHVVDAAETEPGRWSLLFDDRHASHEVVVRAGQPGEWIVLVDGAVVPVRSRDGRRRGRGASDEASGGPARIVAPMPGKVVRVLVGPGDLVEARQGVAVVEAMKMENELRAPRAGTVREVPAREGALVEAGQLLVTIE